MINLYIENLFLSDIVADSNPGVWSVPDPDVWCFDRLRIRLFRSNHVGIGRTGGFPRGLDPVSGFCGGSVPDLDPDFPREFDPEPVIFCPDPQPFARIYFIANHSSSCPYLPSIRCGEMGVIH